MTITQEAPAVAWTADMVNRALYAHFARQSWAVLFEVGAHAKDLAEAGRRIDALCIRNARRMGLGHHELLAIEVKVTRADFLQDVRRPEKQAAWKRTAHRHAYAVPKGLVGKDEVPEECGLLEVDGAGRVAQVSWVKRAPYTPTDPAIPSWLVTTLALRLGWAEGQAKGYSGVTTYDPRGEDTVESLRTRLRAAQQAAERAESKAMQLRSQRDLWKAAFAAAGGLPCEFCGQPIKPGRPGRGGTFDKWVHVKTVDGEVCEVTREARARDEAQARWDALDETERARWLDDSCGYRYGPSTPESIVRAWSYAPHPRPSDDLLPEGATPDE